MRAARTGAASLRGVRGAALALAALAGGCGYSSGLRLPEHYQTVGVEIFGNDGPEIDVERDLHLEMAQQVSELLHAPLTPPLRADVVVQGVIEDYSRRGGIRDGTDNRLLESAVVIRTRAWLVDGSTGETIGRTARATARIGYVVEEQQGELRARGRALRDVAQRLVLDLFTSLE
jgi:hypothetical protein